MPHYSQKYYVKYDFYNNYLVKLVNNRKLNKNILNWFYIYESFKK